MTYSLAFTSSVNYDSTNYGTVLTEYCETWLVDRGWSVTAQSTQPDSGFYSWHCEKNITLQDGTTKRFGKIVAGTSSYMSESSWASGDPVATSNKTDIDSGYERYTSTSTSNVSGQWKMYTSDDDDDTFLLTIGNDARLFWPRSGTAANYIANPSFSDLGDPVWDEEPALCPDSSSHCTFSVRSGNSYLMNVSDNTSFQRADAAFVYEFASIRGSTGQNILFDTSGDVGMYECGDRTSPIDVGLNTLFVDSTSTYYIRVGSNSDGGSLLLNHGSVNPNL